MINNQKGFTLVELLLSMVFGLIVLSGVLYVYIAVISSSSATLKASKLNTELMTIMSIITSDIRRSGYWSETGALASENVFNVQGDTAIEVFKSDNTQISENTDLDGTCIVYSYDQDEDGNLDVKEYFGFRLKSGAIEMLTTASITKGDNCNTGSWEKLSEPSSYTISSFTVNPRNSACVNSNEPDGLDDDGANGIDDDDERDCYAITPNAGDITVETREFIIEIAGELTDDSFITHSLTQNVRVRNDLVRVR